MIKLSNQLSLPLDFITQASAILAMRRAGKSYTARRIVEQVLHAGQQVCIVDPKGDWWGIRSSSDGKRPGFPVVIIGGEHGDVPIEATAGEVVARMVAEERVTILIDLSPLSKGNVAKFMADFLETLYRVKAQERYRTPMLLVVDEADAIAPQKPIGGQERMLGAADDIVRRGGQRGIGVVMISQRPAVLNKNVLSQCPILFALRTTGTHDIEAADDWLKNNAPDHRAQIKAALPSLTTGHPWVISSLWPGTDGIFKQVIVLPIETFDSGATPEVGHHRVMPKTAADVDLSALQKRMADTIERGKAENPALLKKRVAELERELAKRNTPATPPAPAVDPKEFQRQINAAVETAKEELRKKFEPLSKAVLAFAKEAPPLIPDLKSFTFDAKFAPTPIRTPLPVQEAPRRMPSVNGDKKIGKCEMALLTAVAQMAPDRSTRKQVSILSGYSITSSTFSNGLSNLRVGGYIAGTGDSISLTPAGKDLAGDVPPKPTGQELLAFWMGKLGQAERRLLQVIVSNKEIDRDRLSAISNYSQTSSTFSNALSTIRVLGLISGSRELVASEEFFQ